MKISKRIVAVLVAVVLVLAAFVGCSKANTDTPATNDDATTVKMGFIFLHDENSTYDKNFMDAAKAACDEAGIEYVMKTNIDESDACKEAALDLVDQGCNIVFADSFGHEPYIMEAAKENPDVEFCHATGTNAHTANLANFHNAFASIYEGRYLAGVAAGLKLKEMGETKMGYVGAFPYAEVKSGYTSFFLGAKSVVPEVTMDVTFTNSWYDEAKEKEAATRLINGGCKLISQHADSMGAPTACEAAGVPDVSYNGSTVDACPNTFIVSSKINWAPYFLYVIDAVKNGTAIDADWTGTIATGSVEITDVNEKAAAAGTADELAKVKAGLEDGSIKVFDTANWTAEGKTLDSYMADVDSDEAYTPDTEAIKDGAFEESTLRSAPYFDINIDGITILE